MKDGFIIVNKPTGITSHAVVKDMQRALGTGVGRHSILKVGHTGTLDPMATGVLVICIGKATRTIEYLDMDLKTYRATMKLGIKTDTQDIIGRVLEEKDASGITAEKFDEAAKSFIGDSFQIPPLYSAVWVEGRRLYDIARNGEAGEADDAMSKVQPRKMYVENLEIESFGGGEATFLVTCSKGSYIRTICNDIGEKLGCGGCMTALERVAIGSFNIKDAVPYELVLSEKEKSFAGEEHEELWKYLLPTDYPLSYFGSVETSKEQGDKFVGGWHLALKDCEVKQWPKFYHDEPPYDVRPEYREAYKVYAAGEFLGVAFYNHQYHRLVADKVLK